MDIRMLCDSEDKVPAPTVASNPNLFVMKVVKLENAEHPEGEHGEQVSHCSTDGPNSLHSGDHHHHDDHSMRAKKDGAAFTCDICQRPYSTKGNLVVHQRTVHRGERRFPCGDCKRGFATKFGRDRHMQMVHLNHRPFPCDKCDKTFKTKNCVRRHMQLSHDL